MLQGKANNNCAMYCGLPDYTSVSRWKPRSWFKHKHNSTSLGVGEDTVTTEILRQYWNVRRWSKEAHFFECKPTLFVPQTFQDFVKVTDSDTSLESLIVTRVEPFGKKRDSSRVTNVLYVTRVESESLKNVTLVDSLTRVTLSLVHGHCHMT